MVGFKNRYFVMEVFLNPNQPITDDDPIVLTQFNVSKAIKDSILLNFGECGLASCASSFQVKHVNPFTKICIVRSSREEHKNVWAAMTMVRSIGSCPVYFSLLDLSGNIRACKVKALKCEEAKFENYKMIMGSKLTEDVFQLMHNYLEKVKLLEN